MSRVRTHGAERELAVGERSRSEDLGRGRVELKVWRRTERSLQVEEEESVVLYRAHTGTQRAVRERGRRICPPGNDRSKIHG